jgi:hypothetical protein
MYVDKQTEFSDAQAVTASAISSNVLDLFSVKAGGAAAADISPNTRIDIGEGTGDLWLVVSTQTSITDAGSDATLVVTLESADDAALTTNAIVHASTGTLAFATYATAGTTILATRLPPGLYRRYLGLRYTVASGPFTGGAIDAYLTPTLQLNRPYKSGFTVQ